MVMETYQAIVEIEETTENSLGMHRTGCLYAAVSPAFHEEIHKLAAVSSQSGLKVEQLDTMDAPHLVPWLKLLNSAFLIFMPEDGYIDGYMLASGYLNASPLAWSGDPRADRRPIHPADRYSLPLPVVADITPRLHEQQLQIK
jgi:hypothetical protein